MANAKSNEKLHCLIECAIMVALSMVLNQIKLFSLPLGGSVTLLSMLPIVVFSIRRGIGWGLISGFVFALLKTFLALAEVLSWGLTPVALVGCIILDYLLPFTVLGLGGLFRKYKRPGMIAGTALALFLRFCSHLASGTLIFDIWMPEDWSNPFLYSVVYNGSYMLPELIFTIIAVIILTATPAFRRIMENKD